MSQVKIDIINLSKEELTQHLKDLGEPSFRVKQIWQWLYYYGVTDFAQMSNISKALRQKLSEHFLLERPKIVSEQKSSDGTHKWLLEFADGQRVETVYIPEEERGTVCVSSQIGCAMGCKFCHTGSQKITRNLTAGEVVSQFMLVKDIYKEWDIDGQSRMVSNVVFMGMGEPLQNYDNMVRAIKILGDCEGLCVSRRKMTLSTCGITPLIKNIEQDMGVRLAISLHASNDKIRSELMPINKKYPLDSLLRACKDYQEAGGGFVTFEYLMLDNINDKYEHVAELVYLMKKYKIDAKFNLIRFNSWPGCDYVPSSKNRIYNFSQELQKHRFAAPIRSSRGDDILAACGQLKSKKL